jgi:hypothetical protein
MAILQPGQLVEFKQPVLVGSVLKAEIIDNKIQYLVDYTNDEGVPHQRWFTEDEVQVQ